MESAIFGLTIRCYKSDELLRRVKNHMQQLHAARAPGRNGIARENMILLKRAYPAALEHGNMENVRCFAVRCEAVICVVLGGGYEPWRFLLSNSFPRSSPTTIAKSACTVKATSQAVGGHRYQFSPKTTTKKRH